MKDFLIIGSYQIIKVTWASWVVLLFKLHDLFLNDARTFLRFLAGMFTDSVIFNG